MSDLQDLSLVLYIFLVTETYDSNSSKKCETSFKDFLKSLFFDEGEIVKVYKEYITKIIEEVKGREGEIVKVCEEDITKIIEEAKGRGGEIVKVCEEDIVKIIEVYKEYITKIIVKVCKEYITKITEEAKGREREIVKVYKEYIIVKVCKEYITKIFKEAKGRGGEVVKVYEEDICEEDIAKILVKVCEEDTCEEDIAKIVVKVFKEYITKIIEEAKGRGGEIVKVCEEDITKIIVKVCEEYIAKIIYEKYIIKIIKEAKGEIVKVCEEDRVYTYLTYSDDNLAVIKLYKDIKIDELNSNDNEKIRKLNSDINSISQECLSNNNNSFSGYALLASATISSKHECNAEEIASKIILNIYNSNINHNTRISGIDSPNKLTEQSIKTKIGSIDLPTRSTTKQFIKLFGLTYGRGENTLYRSLILYSDRSKEFTESYFYQIIPEILMYNYKVKYIYECFEKYRKKIEEEYKHKNTIHTTNNTENLKNKKINLRKDNTAQVISDLEKKLEHLETTYNNQYKLVNSLSQLVFAAETNFRNIQTILQVHNIPRKLLFEYCFYETESKVETMKFYHHFHYKESDKIKSDIKTIETMSNILRNKLENTENRQSEIRNIILAIIAAIIAFFELVNDELVALLFTGIFGISLSATYIFIVKIVLAAFSLIIPILIYYKVRLGND